MASTQRISDIVSATFQSIGFQVQGLRVRCLRDCSLPAGISEHEAADMVIEDGFAKLPGVEHEYRAVLIGRLESARRQIDEAIAACQSE